MAESTNAAQPGPVEQLNLKVKSQVTVLWF